MLVGYSPGNQFKVDYEEAEQHVMFQCEPVGADKSMFIDYACNMKKV
jgi:hypothetical protein